MTAMLYAPPVEKFLICSKMKISAHRASIALKPLYRVCTAFSYPENYLKGKSVNRASGCRDMLQGAQQHFREG